MMHSRTNPLEKIVSNNDLHYHDKSLRVCVCIDMDSFYASVESRRLGLDDSVPLATIQYNHILAANYSAKALGIKRGVGIEEAKQIYPKLVIVHVDTLKLENVNDESFIDPYKRNLKDDKLEVKPRHMEKMNLDYYRFESDRIYSIFLKHCSIVEKASIDESFLDLTNEVHDLYKTNSYEHEWKGKIIGGETYTPKEESDIFLMIGSQLVDRIRQEVKAVYGYTCSAGIATNKMLSKVASALNKPFGQAIIPDRYKVEALKHIGIRKIRNFGKKVADAFESKNITKIEELQSLSLAQIQEVTKSDEGVCKWIYFRCRGFCDEPIEEKDTANKTITSRKSFGVVKSEIDFENFYTLVLQDLVNRIIIFYQQKTLVPSSLTLLYWDNSMRQQRSTQVGINLKLKKEHFSKIIDSKARELIKKVWNVIMPCGFLGLSVKNFEKSDITQYEFDLFTYAKQKQQEKALKAQQENEPNKVKAKILIDIPKVKPPQEKKNDNIICISDDDDDEGDGNKEGDSSNIYDKQFYTGGAQTISNDGYSSDEKSQSKKILLREQLNSYQTQQVQMSSEPVEYQKCEKCGQSIDKLDLESHMDMHIAEDLDKELNPNKKKYKSVYEKQVQVKDERKSLNRSEEKVKKVSDKQSKGVTKNTKAAQNTKTLENFFAKCKVNNDK